MVKNFLILYIISVFILPQSAYAKKPPVFDAAQKLQYVNICWWEKFEDPYLTFYILEAVKNNHDTKKTAYKTEQFRQQVKYSLGEELPSANVGANYLGIKVPLLDNFRLRKNAFILPFQFKYEADLLGKNRDKTKSVQRLFRAQKYNEKSAYIMLVSDVGTTYINILKFDKTIALQKEYLKNREEIFKRTLKMYKYGTISRTQVNNEEQNINDIRTELNELEKSRSFLLHQLALLVGQSADCACNLERLDIDDFGKNMSAPLEVSSDLIFNRPDLLEAQAKLESAKIDIRVAKKEFFPTFNINGFYVFNTLGPGNFFSWRATFAALILGASQDLFTGERKLANLRISKAKYEELFEDYMQKDLNAIKEVNDALCQLRYDLSIYNEAQKKYSAQDINYSLDNHRFNRGTISYLSLLENQNKLIETRQNFIEKKSAKFIDAISLYKSVGGQL